MTSRDLIIHIMNSLLEQYNPIVENLEIRQMKKEDDPYKLTLNDIREKLMGCFVHIIYTEEHKSKRENSLNRNCQKQFKGTCQYCVMYGHRVAVSKMQ